MSAVPRPIYVWMRMAEDFVALRVVTLITHVIEHLRNLLTFALVTALLLVISVSVYPFYPTRFVTLFAWTLVLLVVAVGFVVIVRMERNEILSRLNGSKPGSIGLNFGFISHLFVYVVLPLVAVLAHIFPEIGDALFSWVQPVLRLVR